MDPVADERVAVMAIKPEFVRAIFEGRKRVEFRRRVLAPDITSVAVYETSPTSALVGVFEVVGQVESTPQSLWRRFRSVAGIDRRDYFEYFQGAARAVAIEIGTVQRFDQYVSLTEVGRDGIAVPQSVHYVPPAAIPALT